MDQLCEKQTTPPTKEVQDAHLHELLSTWVASGAADHLIKIWDERSGECVKTLKGCRSWVLCLAAMSDGNLISGCEDGDVRIWDVEIGRCLRVLKGHNFCVTSVAHLGHGRSVTSAKDNTICIWGANGKVESMIVTKGQEVLAIRSLGAGKFASGADGTYPNLSKFSNPKSNPALPHT